MFPRFVVGIRTARSRSFPVYRRSLLFRQSLKQQQQRCSQYCHPKVSIGSPWQKGHWSYRTNSSGSWTAQLKGASLFTRCSSKHSAGAIHSTKFCSSSLTYGIIESHTAHSWCFHNSSGWMAQVFPLWPGTFGGARSLNGTKETQSFPKVFLTTGEMFLFFLLVWKCSYHFIMGDHSARNPFVRKWGSIKSRETATKLNSAFLTRWWWKIGYELFFKMKEIGFKIEISFLFSWAVFGKFFHTFTRCSNWAFKKRSLLDAKLVNTTPWNWITNTLETELAAPKRNSPPAAEC